MDQKVSSITQERPSRLIKLPTPRAKGWVTVTTPSSSTYPAPILPPPPSYSTTTTTTQGFGASADNAIDSEPVILEGNQEEADDLETVLVESSQEADKRDPSKAKAIAAFLNHHPMFQEGSLVVVSYTNPKENKKGMLQIERNLTGSERGKVNDRLYQIAEFFMRMHEGRQPQIYMKGYSFNIDLEYKRATIASDTLIFHGDLDDIHDLIQEKLSSTFSVDSNQDSYTVRIPE